MSIATSKAEQDEARVKLAGLAVEQLQQDLSFWAVAKVGHQEAFAAATQARGAAGELYAEAEAWTELIGAELALRRKAEGRP